MKIEKIYIESEAIEYPAAQAVCRRLDIPVEVFSNSDVPYRGINQDCDPESRGKRVLLLCRNKGAFIRECPGTANYTCCNYKILHIGSYCPMDCSYCILQAYFHPPVLKFFVNQDDMHAALDNLFEGSIISRVGTGEFTDSLVWENINPIAATLIDRFSRQESAVLELKTKTVSIDHLLDRPHGKKTILSWSLNTPHIIRTQERFTASLEARISAAARCQQSGYPLAFHFDPMVIYPGCEKEYRQVVDRLFDAISPENIVWISMGTFRFMPLLKPVIERRFPDSKIAYGEFIKGLDGKMRYFKPLRIGLYRVLADAIRRRAPHATIYFCMEDDEVWEKALGFVPEARGGLPAMLDRSAVDHCNLKGITIDF